MSEIKEVPRPSKRESQEACQKIEEKGKEKDCDQETPDTGFIAAGAPCFEHYTTCAEQEEYKEEGVKYREENRGHLVKAQGRYMIFFIV